MVARICLVLSMMVAIGCGGDDGGGNKPIDSPQAPDDGQAAIDAARDASTTGAPGIGPACGTTTCTGTDICCLGSTTTCRAPALCPTQSFACDGAEDCAGGTCCFGNGGQGGSLCQSGTNCGAVACHEDADCSGTTPKCCPKSFTPGYHICLPQCV